MRKQQDPYSRENIIAAINLVGHGMTASEKRALLERMTAQIEQLTAEARDRRLGHTSGANDA